MPCLQAAGSEGQIGPNLDMLKPQIVTNYLCCDKWYWSYATLGRYFNS